MCSSALDVSTMCSVTTIHLSSFSATFLPDKLFSLEGHKLGSHKEEVEDSHRRSISVPVGVWHKLEPGVSARIDNGMQGHFSMNFVPIS